MIRILIILSLFFSIISCSNDKDKIQLSEQQLYDQAIKSYDKKEFEKSAEKFKQLEDDYPYSRYTKEGLIKGAMANYHNQKYDDAVLQLKRYLQVYPGGDKADYAYYLMGVCYYDQIVDTRRDQSITLKAKQSFQDLLSNYPDSDYVSDAGLKLDVVQDHLAGKEMEVGRYYLTQQNWLAAINRFKMVVKDYPKTAHSLEALHRLVEAYLSLGVVAEAQNAAAVLGHNAPESQWYKASYALLKDKNLQPSLTDKSWLGL